MFTALPSWAIPPAVDGWVVGCGYQRPTGVRDGPTADETAITKKLLPADAPSRSTAADAKRPCFIARMSCFGGLGGLSLGVKHSAQAAGVAAWGKRFAWPSPQLVRRVGSAGSFVVAGFLGLLMNSVTPSNEETQPTKPKGNG